MLCLMALCEQQHFQWNMHSFHMELLLHPASTRTLGSLSVGKRHRGRDVKKLQTKVEIAP